MLANPPPPLANFPTPRAAHCRLKWTIVAFPALLILGTLIAGVWASDALMAGVLIGLVVSWGGAYYVSRWIVDEVEDDSAAESVEVGLWTHDANAGKLDSAYARLYMPGTGQSKRAR